MCVPVQQHDKKNHINQATVDDDGDGNGDVGDQLVDDKRDVKMKKIAKRNNGGKRILIDQ